MRRQKSIGHVAAVVLFFVSGCSSETEGTGAGIGATCQASSACGSGLRCAKESDEPSACIKDCTSDADCGEGAKCVETDIGPDHQRSLICVKSCTTAGRAECGPWTCNLSKGACETP